MQNQNVKLIICSILFVCGLSAYGQSSGGDLKSRFAADEAFWQDFNDHIQHAEALEREDDARKQKALSDQEEAKIRNQKASTLRFLYNAKDNLRVAAANGSPGDRTLAALSLVQVLLRIVKTDDSLTAEEKTEQLKEAQKIAAAASAESTDKIQRARAVYLQAMAMSALGDKARSKNKFKEVSNSGVNDKVVVFALAELGDRAFSSEDFLEASKNYKKASDYAKKIGGVSTTQVVIAYRLAWSQYRSADITECLQSIVEYSLMDYSGLSVEKSRSMQEDLSTLAANSLYELDGEFTSKSKWIRGLRSKDFAANVFDQLVKRYRDSGLDGVASRVAAEARSTYPMSKYSASWLAVEIDIASKSTNNDEEVNQLRLQYVDLLGRWVEVFREQEPIVKRAAYAALEKASLYYDKKFSTENESANLHKLAGVYQSLQMIAENDDDKMRNGLKGVQCWIRAKGFTRGLAWLDKLLAQQINNEVFLREASWLRAVAREGLYFDANERSEQSAEAKDLANRRLIEFAAAAEEYANRFPKSEDSASLLLRVASAYRDANTIELAARFWNRVLMMDTSVGERSIAIRGVVAAEIALKSASSVVETAQRFLALEDFTKLGQPLRSELLGVLATAAVQAGTTYSQSGDMQSAGKVLLRSAYLDKNLPQREKMLRDGAYMLAVAGDWASARQAARDYLDSGNKVYSADMLYLHARANEFEMRFADAAKDYLEFGTRFAADSRALICLDRSYQLASAENRTDIMVESAERASDLTKNSSDKIKRLEQAFLTVEKQNNRDAMKKLALRAMQVATDTKSEQSFRASWMMSIVLAEKSIVQATSNLRNAAEKLEQNKTKLSASEYSLYFGKIYFALGELASRSFNAYDLEAMKVERSDALDEKKRLYEVMKRQYVLASRSRHPDWMPRARFELATQAQIFADKLTTIYSKELLTLQYVNRLRDEAKKLHGENVAWRNKGGLEAKSSEWARLSSLRLGSSGGRSTESQRVSTNIEITPNFEL